MQDLNDFYYFVFASSIMVVLPPPAERWAFRSRS
jgi:hypothetical protein